MFTFLTKISDGNTQRWVEVETSTRDATKNLFDQIEKKIATGNFKESKLVPLESERENYAIEVKKPGESRKAMFERYVSAIWGQCDGWPQGGGCGTEYLDYDLNGDTSPKECHLAVRLFESKSGKEECALSRLRSRES